MLISLLVLGFLVGMRHAFEADHVAAVASLAANSRTLAETIRLGSVWGVGHTLTLFGFGLVALTMDALIPEQVSGMLEALVGLMLVLLGGDLLRRIHNHRSMPHVHTDEGLVATLGGTHPALGSQAVPLVPGRALLVGMVHGMAGSAALIVLALQTVDSVSTGLLYIALFGIGSIVGMSLCAAAISVPLRWVDSRAGIQQGLQLLIALATVVLGGMILWEHGMSWTAI
jgi:hypothetical protein